MSNQGRYADALDQFRLSLSLSTVQSTPAAAALAEEATQEIDRIETILRDANGAQLQQEQMMMDGEEEDEEEEEALAQDYAYVQEGDEEEEDDDHSGMGMGVRRGRLFGEQDDDEDDI